MNLFRWLVKFRNGLDELVIIYDFEQPEPWVNEFDYQADRNVKANIEKVLESYLSDSESTGKDQEVYRGLKSVFHTFAMTISLQGFLYIREKIHQRRRAAEGKKFIKPYNANWNGTY